MLPPDPHQIRKAADFNDEYLHLVVKSNLLEAPLKAFGVNMERIRKLIAMPIFLTAATCINEAFRVAAIYESGFKLGDPRLTIGDKDFVKSLWDPINELRINKANEYLRTLNNAPVQLRDMGEAAIKSFCLTIHILAMV